MWYIVVLVSGTEGRLEAVVPVYSISADRARVQALLSMSKEPGDLYVATTVECGKNKPNLV